MYWCVLYSKKQSITFQLFFIVTRAGTSGDSLLYVHQTTDRFDNIINVPVYIVHPTSFIRFSFFYAFTSLWLTLAESFKRY